MSNIRSNSQVDKMKWCFDQARLLKVKCILILNQDKMYAVGLLHPRRPIANNDNEAKT